MKTELIVISQDKERNQYPLFIHSENRNKRLNIRFLRDRLVKSKEINTNLKKIDIKIRVKNHLNRNIKI